MTDFWIQMQLMKYNEKLNIPKIRKYIIYIRRHYPNIDKCDIDLKVIKQSIEILRYNGYILDLDNDHSDDHSKYIIEPNLKDQLMTSIILCNFSSIRKTLIRIRNHHPNLDTANVDKTILKIAVDMLKDNGYEIYFHEDHRNNPEKYIIKIKE